MSGQRVFISHASEDAAVVDRIVAYLEGKGVPCWISSRDIAPKSIYAEAITEAMREAQSCVVVVSAAANGSQAIKRELELASRYNKPFIPVRIDATEPGPGLDYYLNNTQWVDYGRDRDRALDRVVAAYAARTGAMPAAPRPAPKRGTAVLIPLLVAGALLLGGGAWFALTQMRETQSPPTPTQADMDQAGASLVGTYNWLGIACGEGPTVALAEDGGGFYFTMPGTPTYRHEVLGVAVDAGVSIETRVTEPAEHAGERYTFFDNGTGTLEVRSPERSEQWERCDAEAAAQSAPADAAATIASVAGTTWSGVWGEENVRATWNLHADGRACGVFNEREVCDWRWVQNGDALAISSQGETWSGRLQGDVFSGELRQGHGAELQAIATPLPFRLERQS